MMENDTIRTAGLEHSIQLCVGVGVMLRRGCWADECISWTTEDTTTIDAVQQTIIQSYVSLS